MNITHFSRERLYRTFKQWEVPLDLPMMIGFVWHYYILVAYKDIKGVRK